MLRGDMEDRKRGRRERERWAVSLIKRSLARICREQLTGTIRRTVAERSSVVSPIAKLRRRLPFCVLLSCCLRITQTTGSLAIRKIVAMASPVFCRGENEEVVVKGAIKKGGIHI